MKYLILLLVASALSADLTLCKDTTTYIPIQNGKNYFVSQNGPVLSKGTVIKPDNEKMMTLKTSKGTNEAFYILSGGRIFVAGSSLKCDGEGASTPSEIGGDNQQTVVPKEPASALSATEPENGVKEQVKNEKVMEKPATDKKVKVVTFGSTETEGNSNESKETEIMEPETKNSTATNVEETKSTETTETMQANESPFAKKEVEASEEQPNEIKPNQVATANANKTQKESASQNQNSGDAVAASSGSDLAETEPNENKTESQETPQPESPNSNAVNASEEKTADLETNAHAKQRKLKVLKQAWTEEQIQQAETPEKKLNNLAVQQGRQNDMENQIQTEFPQQMATLQQALPPNTAPPQAPPAQICANQSFFKSFEQLGTNDQTLVLKKGEKVIVTYPQPFKFQDNFYFEIAARNKKGYVRSSDICESPSASSPKEPQTANNNVHFDVFAKQKQLSN